MENPIKDDRIVSNITFATRLYHFIKDVDVNDACNSNEKKSMLYGAKRLLEYQVLTAEEEKEIDYLKRVGVYDKFQPKSLKTEDGFTFFEGDNTTIYSCMQNLTVDNNEIMQFNTERILEGGINPNRLFFHKYENCKLYILENKPQYSQKQVVEFLNLAYSGEKVEV